MNKLMSMLIAAIFATASVGAFAAAHGGAMSDADKAKKMEACKKMDPKSTDEKMKAECKKLMEGEKKPDAKKAPPKQPEPVEPVGRKPRASVPTLPKKK